MTAPSVQAGQGPRAAPARALPSGEMRSVNAPLTHDLMSVALLDTPSSSVLCLTPFAEISFARWNDRFPHKGTPHTCALRKA